MTNQSLKRTLTSLIRRLEAPGDIVDIINVTYF